jgi:hypothetical protein
MKKLTGLLVAGGFAAALAIPAFAGPAGVSKSTTEATAPEIAELQQAAQRALQEGRTGNKNNPEFQMKAHQINALIDRLKSGDQVDPSEIDKALEPVQVW